MPAKNDDVLYWIRAHALVYANDSNAANLPYWLAFREAGAELYRAYRATIELPQGIESVWRTPRFEEMQARYRETWPDNATSPEGAFHVIRRYQRMRILQQYVYDPIDLLSKDDGLTKNADDFHTVEIGGHRWCYADLEGNHRLMAAFYVGLERVPVLLKSRPPEPGAGAAPTNLGG